MGGDGRFEEFGLRCGETYRNCPGFDLATPAPAPWMVGSDTAIGQPSQAGQFMGKDAVALLKLTKAKGV